MNGEFAWAGQHGFFANVNAQEWSRHPFVTRLLRYTDIDKAGLDRLRLLIESEVAIKKRSDLVAEGYAYRKLSFVAEGFAARYKLLRNGKRQVVNVVLPGDIVGLPVSFLERAPYSVIAISDVKMHACGFDAFIQLCYRQPQFGLVLSWLAVQEAATYAEHIVDTGRRTPLERLARFLLEIHARLEAVGRAAPSSFDLPFSQEVMGDVLGLSVPHLNRMVARLRSDGLITITERRIEFADLPAIRRLCHFQSLDLVRIPPPDSKSATSRA
jgi:CRP-like cAMP-binding protein